MMAILVPVQSLLDYTIPCKDSVRYGIYDYLESSTLLQSSLVLSFDACLC